MENLNITIELTLSLEDAKPELANEDIAGSIVEEIYNEFNDIILDIEILDIG